MTILLKKFMTILDNLNIYKNINKIVKYFYKYLE